MQIAAKSRWAQALGQANVRAQSLSKYALLPTWLARDRSTDRQSTINFSNMKAPSQNPPHVSKALGSVRCCCGLNSPHIPPRRLPCRARKGNEPITNRETSHRINSISPPQARLLHSFTFILSQAARPRMGHEDTFGYRIISSHIIHHYRQRPRLSVHHSCHCRRRCPSRPRRQEQAPQGPRWASPPLPLVPLPLPSPRLLPLPLRPNLRLRRHPPGMTPS